MKTGDMLRVAKTGAVVFQTPHYNVSSNRLFVCNAGDTLVYMGECHPTNYYKVLCPRGVGWIYWSNVEFVHPEPEQDGVEYLDKE